MREARGIFCDEIIQEYRSDHLGNSSSFIKHPEITLYVTLFLTHQDIRICGSFCDSNEDSTYD